jgi:small GTP-binding protein
MIQNIRIDLKILVVGCSGTGKTSFVRRWTKGIFKDSYLPTVVSEFGFKIYESNGKFYRIQLWDIGGQDKSLTMAKIFARDSHGCLVVSDSTDIKTLEDTLNWKNIVSEEAEFLDGGKIPFILIQNKTDLIESREDFNKIENYTKKISEDNNFDKYFMTSVKKNVNVEESMTYLIEKIIEKLEEYASNGNIVFNDQKIIHTIKLDNHRERKKENSRCC